MRDSIIFRGFRLPGFLASFLALMLCSSLQAQENTRQQQPRDAAYSSRSPEPSELAKENLERVAASAAQLKEILVKDAGILVELKRWVAKEATDSGQIVDDSSLNDQAIFERLERDIAFRSVATRLVQRYGHLLPTINPDSQIGKEQELLLKERVRRLVQIESQEDTDSLRPHEDKDNDLRGAQDTQCDPRRDRNCAQPGSNRTRFGNPRPTERPGTEPNLPAAPDQTLPSDSARTLRASLSREDSYSRAGSDTDLDPNQPPLVDGFRRPNDTFAASSPVDPPDALPLQPRGNALQALSVPSSSPTRDGMRDVLPSEKGMERTTRRSEDREFSMDRNLPPPAMVRRPSPYSDIPSVYDLYVQASSKEGPSERFGLKIFRNNSLEPDAIPMDLPVGPDYVVGPGDGLAIDLWGGVSQRFFRIVDREGRVSLPEAGPVLVSGHTLGEVQQSVQQLFRTQFRDVSADVSLSRLRTVRVYVVGEVAEPGAYDISSLSTPLNALFAAGGVTPRGSLRALKHFRGKQLVEEVDCYDLLLHGVRSDMARLENGDTLMVSPLGPQVTIEGMVRRPATYELHGETTLEDALELAGGILPAAALQHVEVQRLEAHQKRTMLTLDLSPNGDADTVAKQLSAFKIQDGDQIHIFPIAPYNESSIYLQGHVLRPGRYSYQDGMKLTDLLASYTDLLPEPAAHYAEIVRLNPPDFRPSVESFDLSAAFANPAAAPKLQKLDTVRIFSRYDFEPAPSVWIGGEVRSPGKYRTSGQAHLRDAIFLAGGVAPDASLDSAQLFRTQPDGTMKILSVNLGAALAGNPVDNLVLEPRDRLLVHRNSAAVDPPTVDVKGEVAKPGRYPLTTNMHVEDLVLVAGGLKRSADPVKADLTRFAAGASSGNSVSENMPIALSAAMEGNANENVALRNGDVLTIRQVPGWNDLHASISVQGEVEHPGSYGIRPGERLSSVLQRAGGFSPQAYPYGALLTRRDVRDVELKSHEELEQRLKAEIVNLKALPETEPDQKNLKLTAIAETETALKQLETTAPIGRVVIHIRADRKSWQNSSNDPVLRDGDVLVVPKEADYIVVAGQVYNPTAVGFQQGRSAKWYLSQSGGLTQLADKKAVFVVRADGSVLASKNNGDGWWSGDPLSATLRAGDTIVVPEKAPRIGNRNWSNLFQTAQVASSVALAVAYIHP
jgi:protein involved in polysaccharide export with SLBB domain